jgi:hypothetical protein
MKDYGPIRAFILGLISSGIASVSVSKHWYGIATYTALLAIYLKRAIP